MENILTVYKSIGPCELGWTFDFCKKYAGEDAVVLIHNSKVYVKKMNRIYKFETNGK